ncbi:MAG: cold-shock protein [Anaerolineae bacterium]|jgi:CspA family cold shock protein|nr:cold-shock protein [Anaerolineae bacterium]
MSGRIRGEVKWFDAEKGYGFIKQPAGSDIFVHYTAIQSDGYKTLDAGDVVEYELVDGRKGQQASSVVIITKSPSAPPR